MSTHLLFCLLTLINLWVDVIRYDLLENCLYHKKNHVFTAFLTHRSKNIDLKFILQCVREVLLLGHRQAFAWIDQWIDMTYEDVRNYENQLQQETNSLLRKDLPPSSPSATATPPSTPGLLSSDPQTAGSLSSSGSTPGTPKSPVKKGYFNWF